MLPPWLGMAVVAGSLAVLIVALRAWQHYGIPHPELPRKCLHMGMGLLTLSFPWLFDCVWPIVVLGVLSAGTMLALRLVKRLRSSVGCVVTGVSRLTFGEVYFPIAVAILFILYLHNKGVSPERRLLLYVIPILLLTLADATAALIGIRYGQAHYQTSDGRKSLEGSLGFFLVAFFCTHVPLLLGTDSIARADTLLIALLLAWVAMMFEAIAWAGLDNLALPLVSYLLLKIYLDLSQAELLLRLAVTGGLTVFAIVYSRWSTLVGSAIFGVVLVGYICWALGGWQWVWAPLILFLTYTLLSPQTPVNMQRVHNIHAVVCVSSAGLIWLFLYRIFEWTDLDFLFLFLFTLSFAAHLAIIGIARLGCDYPQMSTPSLLVLCTVKAWFILFVPYAVMAGPGQRTLLFAGFGLLGVGLAACSFSLWEPDTRNCSLDTPRWLRQAACASFGSTIGLVPLFFL